MINQEMWEEWQENPVTEVLLKYLKDSIKEESELVADTILAGGVMSEIEQVRIGTTCETLERISEITPDEIEEFYKEEEE